MKSTSKNKQTPDAVSPLRDELLKINNEPTNQEVVIYDECGDTLWDRVLEQGDLNSGTEQKQIISGICKIKNRAAINK